MRTCFFRLLLVCTGAGHRAETQQRALSLPNYESQSEKSLKPFICYPQKSTHSPRGISGDPMGPVRSPGHWLPGPSMGLTLEPCLHLTPVFWVPEAV